MIPKPRNENIITIVTQLANSWLNSLMGIASYAQQNTEKSRFWKRWHVKTIDAKLLQNEKLIFIML